MSYQPTSSTPRMWPLGSLSDGLLLIALPRTLALVMLAALFHIL
jgi:hypothetical protein